uniref:Core Histone H2A/H2B/H3 domain-containing protein n=1 Tax=Neogobius melanostomus TaxID=47308 RepID=A0A8C6TLP0_9GOBI
MNENLNNICIELFILAHAPEYLCAEILDLAGSVATQNKKKRIAPRHILLAVRKDTELDTLLCLRCTVLGSDCF